MVPITHARPLSEGHPGRNLLQGLWPDHRRRQARDQWPEPAAAECHRPRKWVGVRAGEHRQDAIPPAPMRAMGLRFPASWTTISTSSSRPKKSPGTGGGNSPRGTLWKHQAVDLIEFGITDLVRVPPCPVNPPQQRSGTNPRALIANSVCRVGY